MAADDSQLGSILGDRYRVDELIGRGGMSTVYRGFDTQLQRPVAIKIFQHGEDEDDLRWESEVRLLSQLNHPHLVTLHDAHLEPIGGGGASYLVMEYVPGKDLQHHLKESGPSGPLATLVIAQIGEALESVHSRGIIHRDLKPGNILIEPSDLPPLLVRAKLADFGIAHLLGSDRVTRTGTMIGTAAYTSPEQVSGEAATPASDVYSLGLVAIECISGRPAFPGTPTESLIARLTRDPAMPTGLPPAWMLLLGSMTARDPALRPSALEAALRSREIAEQLPTVVATSSEASADPEGRTERMLPPTLLLPAAGAAHLADGSSATMVLEGSPGPAPRAARPRRLRLWAIAIAAAAVLIGGIAVLTGLPAGSASPTGSPSATSSATPVLVSKSPTPTQAPVNGNGNGKNGDGNGKKGNK